MITLTLVEQVKKKGIISQKRYIKFYHSTDKARKDIPPIVAEMKSAEKQKREAKIRIDAVSYDTKSERTMLLELNAIRSIDNESEQ